MGSKDLKGSELEQMIMEEMKGLSTETLKEVLDFIQFREIIKKAEGDEKTSSGRGIRVSD